MQRKVASPGSSRARRLHVCGLNDTCLKLADATYVVDLAKSATFVAKVTRGNNSLS